MNHARFQSIRQGLSAVAQKVYDATPIAEEWTTNQIHAELARQGANLNHAITQGCLRSLVGSGLVSEPQRGLFRRVKVRQPAPGGGSKEKEDSEVAKTATAPAATETNPIDKLSALAARCRRMMDLQKELAEDIEMAALEIQDHIAKNDEDMQKLKQLQQLLKSLG